MLESSNLETSQSVFASRFDRWTSTPWSLTLRLRVVGSGYVGLVAGACFADLGHDVILVDNDERKLAALKDGQVPIHENFLPELLSRHRGHRLTFSDDLQ